MDKTVILEAQKVSDYQIHAVLIDKVILLDTTCLIDGLKFNSADEMIEYINTP